MNGCAVGNTDVHRDGRDRLSIYGYLKSIGVAVRHKRQVKGHGFCSISCVVGLLIAESNLEDGFLVGRHIANFALCDGYLRVLQSGSGIVQLRTGLVEECRVGVLPWAAAGTRQPTEDETAVTLQCTIGFLSC